MMEEPQKSQQKWRGKTHEFDPCLAECWWRSLLGRVTSIPAVPEATHQGSLGEETSPSLSLLGAEDNSWYLLKESNLRGMLAVNLQASLLDKSQRASQLHLCKDPDRAMAVFALPLRAAASHPVPGHHPASSQSHAPSVQCRGIGLGDL